jgi:tungstate transport system substrate-binding protein
MPSGTEPGGSRPKRITTFCSRVLAAVMFALPAACGGGNDARAGQDTTQFDSAHAAPVQSIILATTTSTYDSGLLDSLLLLFRRETGIEVKVIAVGTGAALDMARRGNADAVLAHAPASEREHVASGDLTDGQLVMHNDFLIVGPRDELGSAVAGSAPEKYRVTVRLPLATRPPMPGERIRVAARESIVL